jgi:hypothetical protein
MMSLVMLLSPPLVMTSCQAAGRMQRRGQGKAVYCRVEALPHVVARGAQRRWL